MFIAHGQNNCGSAAVSNHYFYPVWLWHDLIRLCYVGCVTLCGLCILKADMTNKWTGLTENKQTIKTVKRWCNLKIIIVINGKRINSINDNTNSKRVQSMFMVWHGSKSTDSPQLAETVKPLLWLKDDSWGVWRPIEGLKIFNPRHIQPTYWGQVSYLVGLTRVLRMRLLVEHQADTLCTLPHCWQLNQWLLCQLQILWWCLLHEWFGSHGYKEERAQQCFCARISPSKHLEMRTYSFYESLLFLQDVSKRMSLPMDIRLPPEFLKKLQMENENSPLCKPLSRMSRRASLVSDVSVFAMFVCLFNRTFSFYWLHWLLKKLLLIERTSQFPLNILLSPLTLLLCFCCYPVPSVII